MEGKFPCFFLLSEYIRARTCFPPTCTRILNVLIPYWRFLWYFKLRKFCCLLKVTPDTLVTKKSNSPLCIPIILAFVVPTVSSVSLEGDFVNPGDLRCTPSCFCDLMCFRFNFPRTSLRERNIFGCYVCVNLNYFRLSKGLVPCLPCLIAFVIILIFPC